MKIILLVRDRVINFLRHLDGRKQDVEIGVG